MRKYYLALLVLFCLDRWSKYYILSKPSADFVPGGFLVLEYNQNIAWFWHLPTLGLYILLAAIIFCLFYFWTQAKIQRSRLVWPWGLIIIGAISNLLDRIYHGAVVDFISIPKLTVLNISDIYISLGVLCLLWVELVSSRKKVQFDKKI